MPSIQLHVYATLRAYLNGAGSKEIIIEPGETVGRLLDRCGIPREQTRIIFINNRAAAFGTPLHGGERVGVFPAIGGG